MSAKLRRAEELSYFNAIACLMVIFIHVMSYGIMNVAPASFKAALMYFPWKLASCAVPLFLFSSAAKMAMHHEESYSLRSYGGYMSGRLKRVFLPYLLWSAVYFAAFVLVGYRELSLLGFIKELFLGTISYQFYYIIIAMQFYLLKPLWLLILHRLRWYIVLPCALLVTYFSLHLNSFLGLWDAEFIYKDRIFTTYLIFWVVGLYAGRNWDRLTESLQNAGASIAMAAIVVIAVAVLPYLNYSRGIWFVDSGYFTVFTDVISAFILLWLCLKLRRAPERTKKCLGFISSASYSVYLSHCLFLTVTEKLTERSGLSNGLLILTIRALVCYTVPFALYALLSHIRSRLPRKR